MGDDIYQALKSACNEFFVELMRTLNAEDFILNVNNVDQMPADLAGKTVYDLTDKNAKQIIGLLIAVVNHNEWRNKKPFYFVVRQNRSIAITFKLEPNWTRVQPGNGRVFTRTNNGIFIPYTYKELYLKIKKNNNQTFFQKLKESFKNCNKIIGAMNGVADSFMLLLFEIARRKVNQEDGNNEQQVEPQISQRKKRQELDELPIASFIACAIKLHKPKVFVEIFNPGSKFHCFSKSPETRKRNLMALITLFSWDNQLKNVFQNPEDGEGDEDDTGDEGDNGDEDNTGDEGDNGDVDDTGDEGDNGDEDDTGDEGDNGDEDDTGNEGDNGDEDDTGDEGDNGDEDDTGDEGDNGKGHKIDEITSKFNQL